MVGRGRGYRAGVGLFGRRGQSREFREERRFCSCQGSRRVSGLQHRVRDCKPSSSLRVNATGKSAPKTSICANPDWLQHTKLCTPKQKSNKSFQGCNAPAPDLVESNLLLAKHTHTPFAASDMLEAITNRIIGGFTGTQTSGEHCEVLSQAPFNDKETEAEDPSLPSPSPSTSSHSLLIDPIVYT